MVNAYHWFSIVFNIIYTLYIAYNIWLLMEEKDVNHIRFWAVLGLSGTIFFMLIHSFDIFMYYIK